MRVDCDDLNSVGLAFSERSLSINLTFFFLVTCERFLYRKMKRRANWSFYPVGCVAGWQLWGHQQISVEDTTRELKCIVVKC